MKIPLFGGEKKNKVINAQYLISLQMYWFAAIEFFELHRYGVEMGERVLLWSMSEKTKRSTIKLIFEFLTQLLLKL